MVEEGQFACREGMGSQGAYTKFLTGEARCPESASRGINPFLVPHLLSLSRPLSAALACSPDAWTGCRRCLPEEACGIHRFS